MLNGRKLQSLLFRFYYADSIQNYDSHLAHFCPIILYLAFDNNCKAID